MQMIKTRAGNKIGNIILLVAGRVTIKVS